MELYVVRENDKIIALFTNEQRAKFYCRENLANLHYQKEEWIIKERGEDIMSEADYCLFGEGYCRWCRYCIIRRLEP